MDATPTMILIMVELGFKVPVGKNFAEAKDQIT